MIEETAINEKAQQRRTRWEEKRAKWEAEDRRRSTFGLGLTAVFLNLISPFLGPLGYVMTQPFMFSQPEPEQVIWGWIVMTLGALGAAIGFTSGFVVLSRIRHTSPRSFITWISIWLTWLALLAWGVRLAVLAEF